MADKESLSAFIDGETAADALIVELEQDMEAQESWKNYHLIGDVMRGEAPAVNRSIAESVAAALETEPVHQLKTESVKVLISEAQPTPQQARRYIPAWLTQLGQVAVAASVSLVVVLGVQNYGDNRADFPPEQLTVLQTVPFAGNVEPVSLTRERVTASQASEAQLLEHRRHINAMLQDYELQLRLMSAKAVEVEDRLKTESVTE